MRLRPLSSGRSQRLRHHRCGKRYRTAGGRWGTQEGQGSQPQVRIEKDITQQELADCAGVSKQAVYKYENNIVTNIPMDKLSLIASKLGVTPCFLMGWEDNNSVPEVPDTIKAALQQEDGKVAEIMELFVNLPADKQQEALSYLRYLSASADK